MNTVLAEHIAELTQRLRDRYQDRGFSVEAQVEAAPGLVVDLVACRGDERFYVVLVYPRRSGPPLEAFAELAEAHGAKLSVGLMPREATLQETEIPTRSEVEARLDQAGQVKASAWLGPIAAMAALEAAGRYALARAFEGTIPGPTGRGCIQGLAHRGLISPEDEAALLRLLELRNAAAHGAAHLEPDAALVQRGLRVARSLLEPEPSAA